MQRLLNFFVILSGTLSLLYSGLLLAQVGVYLDRYAINENETVLLTVEVDQRSARRPDFSPLNKDFHFLGSKQMSVSSHTNGNNTYSSRWQILLRPRKSGELQIPELLINDEVSPTISLTVLPSQNRPAAAAPQNEFIEHNVDNNEIYVNSQLLYSIKVFHQEPLAQLAHLQQPELDNAEVKPLGEPRQYTTRFQGESYQVLEHNYAIFPLQPGQLVIPQASFRNGPGAAEVTSPPLNIAILNQAPQDPPGFWLPSSKASITENWQMPEPLVPGAAIRRTITLSAEGVPASNLPSLMPLRNELARIAIEEVTLNEEVTGAGLVSSRTEVITIIPTERGEVTLPQIVIPWWNTERDRNERATLPSAILRVIPGAAPISIGESLPPADAVKTMAQTEPAQKATAAPAMQENTATEPAAPANAQPVPAPATDTTPALPLASPQDNSLPFIVWLLAGFSILCALGWLYTFARLRKMKQDPFAPSMPLTEDQTAAPEAVEEELDAADLMAIQLAEEEAFNATIQACHQGMALEARLMMLEWARYIWPDKEVQNSMDMINASGSKTLELLLIDLENHINEHDTDDWAGDLLANALYKIRERQSVLLQTL
ncbi:BatD family protein [Aliamphritea spongicola]|uniref:BatD family protein n=1 Tax=Aliamphritea spongicola TaxID=707589 RepID=UPI00196AE569|nr:BatD family protein [Aliamphritea spongicola]MBN3561542.1 BatD family protein [Aliamphritea spongicola]